MRAMKRTVSVLLSLMLVLGMVTIGVSAVSAAETNTVTFTSNIGASGSIDYTPGTTTQVTVTYKLASDVGIINSEGVVTFDKNVLKVASSNTAATFAPNLQNACPNLAKTDGRIPFTTSQTDAADFSTAQAFVVVTFDVIGSGNTTVNLNVGVLTGNTIATGTTSATDVTLVDGDTVDTTKFTAAVEATKTPGGIDVDPSTILDGHALNLQGKVGVMFYYQKPAAIADCEVKAVLSSSFDEDVEVVLDENSWNVYDEAYRVTYFVPSTRLTAPITNKVYADGQLVAEETYAAKTYIDRQIAKASVGQTTKDLLYALAEYGSSAQLYFQTLNPSIDYDTDNLPNAGLDYTAPVVTADDIDAPSYTRPDYSSLGINNDEIYTSMILDADTAIEVDFGLLTSDRSAIDAADVKVKGVSADYEYHANYNEVAYTIANIASNKYATEYSVDFGNGLLYTININNRLKNVLSRSSSSAEYKKLAAAMFTYGQAAYALFGDAGE